MLTLHQFLPDVIALRRQLIPDYERQTWLVGSLLNQDLLEQVNVREKALFIAAGVLYSFGESQIKEYLTHLAGRFPGAELIFDASSPIGINMTN